MTPVFVDPDLARAGFARNILESAGIACFLQNENTRSLGVSLLGYSNTALLNPTVYVTDASQAEKARELLQEHFPDSPAPAGTADWTCPACNESNPPTFDLCWNCQAARPD